MTATATREANAESAFELARDCLQRGWQPVPIDRGQKRPRDNAWQSLAITEANVEDYFGNDDNVGVQLGVRSGGLTQIGGEDFKSTPKRIEKARRVEKCWSLMARLSVKFADLEQASQPIPDKRSRRRHGEGRFSEVIENKEVFGSRPSDTKSNEINGLADSAPVGALGSNSMTRQLTLPRRAYVELASRYRVPGNNNGRKFGGRWTKIALTEKQVDANPRLKRPAIAAPANQERYPPKYTNQKCLWRSPLDTQPAAAWLTTGSSGLLSTNPTLAEDV